MKIAIYHNLDQGGGLLYIEKITKEFVSNNNQVDLFALNDNLVSDQITQKKIFQINRTKNIFAHLFQAIHEIPAINRTISKEIKKGNYDVVFVFPCKVAQTPSIIANLNIIGQNYLYFFLEPKREFYERVSFDHFSARRLMARIIRLPLKLLDQSNCKLAKKIVSSSIYTNSLLKKIYNKQGVVIYPGLESVPIKRKVSRNRHGVISVGLLSMLKGHIFSISQVMGIAKEFVIIGNISHESEQIAKMINQSNKTKVKVLCHVDDCRRDKYYEKSTIYLANQINEPFGLTTLEASSHNLYVLGTNSGGTGEIIDHGINGFLYNKEINTAKNYFKRIYNKSTIAYYSSSKTNWQKTVQRIQKII